MLDGGGWGDGAKLTQELGKPSP